MDVLEVELDLVGTEIGVAIGVGVWVTESAESVGTNELRPVGLCNGVESWLGCQPLLSLALFVVVVVVVILCFCEAETTLPRP